MLQEARTEAAYHDIVSGDLAFMVSLTCGLRVGGGVCEGAPLVDT